MSSTTVTAPPVALRLFINGRWTQGEAPTLVSTSPTNPTEVVAEGATATPDQVKEALNAAHSAASSWAKTTIATRGEILERAAQYIAEHADAWGLEMAREEGKTQAEARGEVLRAAQIFEYFASQSTQQSGSLYPSPRAGEQLLVVRKPLGVVGVITPFNFPIAIPAWKIAPALIYGNTVVWKPASTVPLLAMRLVQALEEAGLPAGVLNLVIGPGALGDVILNHPALDGLTFTGSTAVGRQLVSQAAANGIPAQAEMGGKNAAIVLRDADLDLAAEQVLFGAFRSTGQKCTATSRLILDDEIADTFLVRLITLLDEWKSGDPTQDDVHMGPVVTVAAAEEIRNAVTEAINEGARPLYQSNSMDFTGAFVAPTVLELDDISNSVWTEELFGPVLTVCRAATVDEAFALANDSDFGLSCAVFTTDLKTSLRAIEELKVGMLHVNSETTGADPHVPFGGAKKSGYGPKEQGEAARDFFTSPTTVYLQGA